ncbi:MAG: phage major capsid protein [Desulfobacterales bacterium]
MSFAKIKNDIKAISAEKFKIISQAEAEGRETSPREEVIIAEFEGALNSLYAELEKPGKPQTLMGPSGSIGKLSRGGGSDGLFKSDGEFFQCIMAASTPGGRIDPRLYNAATGLGETVPSDGGFLLQPSLSNDIFTTAFETGKLAKLCRKIPITSNSNGIKIPGLDETSRVAGSRQGGVLSYWISEAAEKQASKPKFRLVELSLKKSVVLIYSTDELLQDAAALEAFIKKAASDELAFNQDDAILNGTGAGQPLGILNSGALVTVAKEAGQPADTVITENIVKMWSRMLGSSRKNAVWLINQNVEPQLYTMSLAVGTGGSPIFMPGGALSQEPYMTLFGRPIIPCEQCPTLGDAGDIILASFQDGYVIAEKGGIQTDVSIHVQFIQDESIFRFVYRWDGSPMLASPVTPFSGSASDTQSHFVALASRA